ncbi:MAG: Ig-like domain-containing protein [Bacteroidales bacterium]|nr:Ig-like domain-containing protein [Bacteroidales bacterium]
MNRFATIIVFGLLAGTACDNADGLKSDIYDTSVTVGASHISCVSAVLSGKANLGKTMSSDLMMGIMYSESSGVLPSTATILEASDIDDKYSYSVSIAGLVPKTKYYYRSFVYQSGSYTYGNTKSFTTKDVSSLIATKEVTKVEGATAYLSAKLNLTDVNSESVEYGFYYGTSESNQSSYKKGGIIESNEYSAVLSNLSHKTQYWYKAYVRVDRQAFSGEIKSFKTGIVPVDSVYLNRNEYCFTAIGGSIALRATILPSDATNKTVAWASDNVNVATVDANGRVTARGNGTACITVTTQDQEKIARCAITVSQHLNSISLSQTSMTLNEGTSQILTASMLPDNAVDKEIVWTTSDKTVADVDSTGKVLAVNKGEATIIATAHDGSGVYASCEVLVIRPVSAISFNKTSIALYGGETESITATVIPRDASNTSLRWTSSNSSVATVSSAGVIAGHTRGEVIITATAEDGSGIYANCAVEVKQYVTNLELDKTSISIMVGEEETLTVTRILPDIANDKSYSWSSSDYSVVTVDNDGRVLGLKKGKAKIYAVANHGTGPGSIVACEVVVSSSCPSGAVDLGLKTKEGYNLYWATCNLCESGFVSAPEEYGDYYAWGETETKDNYSWSTYKFGVSDNGPFSKYDTNVDGKIVLDAGYNGDDLASKQLGSSWRMPTEEECQELVNLCTWRWKTTADGFAVNGYLVSATNGNSIFLPAAGSALNQGTDSVNSRGYYWSASLCSESPNSAMGIYFNQNVEYNCGRGVRFRGRTIRPVAE